MKNTLGDVLKRASSKQWIHHAQKEWTDAHDVEAKLLVSSILKEDYNLKIVYDRTIFISKNHPYAWSDIHPTGYSSKQEIFHDYWIQMPDMLDKRHGIICEVDGPWHWQTSKGVKQTNERNYHYELACLKLVWLTIGDVMGNLDTLKDKIAFQLGK